tara:strand:- start:579 stop:1268 length:690 start_codon:yes stop_codon:yes gene_type:complete
LKVTDRTLLVLGMVTFLVVLGCVSVVLINIGGVDGLTGYATINRTVGYVNISVKSAIAVTLTNATLVFDAGVLNPSGETQVNTSRPAGDNPGGFGKPGPFKIRNDGNVFVNITINSSATHVNLFGALDPPANFSYAIEDVQITGGGNFQVNKTCHGAGGGITDGNYSTHNATQPFGITFSTIPSMLCPNMSYTTNDELNISIFFNLTDEVINGTYNTSIQLTVTSLGHS